MDSAIYSIYLRGYWERKRWEWVGILDSPGRGQLQLYAKFTAASSVVWFLEGRGSVANLSAFTQDQ